MNEDKSQINDSTTVQCSKKIDPVFEQMKFQTPLAGIISSIRILLLLGYPRKRSNTDGGDSQ